MLLPTLHMLQAGSTHMYATPAGQTAKADYAGIGVWNMKAAAEARKFGEVQTPAGSAATPDGRYPPVEEW